MCLHKSKRKYANSCALSLDFDIFRHLNSVLAFSVSCDGFRWHSISFDLVSFIEYSRCTHTISSGKAGEHYVAVRKFNNNNASTSTSSNDGTYKVYIESAVQVEHLIRFANTRLASIKCVVGYGVFLFVLSRAPLSLYLLLAISYLHVCAAFENFVALLFAHVFRWLFMFVRLCVKRIASCIQRLW